MRKRQKCEGKRFIVKSIGFRSDCCRRHSTQCRCNMHTGRQHQTKCSTCPKTHLPSKRQARRTDASLSTHYLFRRDGRRGAVSTPCASSPLLAPQGSIPTTRATPRARRAIGRANFVLREFWQLALLIFIPLFRLLRV